MRIRILIKHLIGNHLFPFKIPFPNYFPFPFTIPVLCTVVAYFCHTTSYYEMICWRRIQIHNLMINLPLSPLDLFTLFLKYKIVFSKFYRTSVFSCVIQPLAPSDFTGTEKQSSTHAKALKAKGVLESQVTTTPPVSGATCYQPPLFCTKQQSCTFWEIWRLQNTE